MLSTEEKFVSHFYELKRAHHDLSFRDISNLAVILRLFLIDNFADTLKNAVNRTTGKKLKFIYPIDKNQDTVSKSRTFLAGYLLAAEPSTHTNIGKLNKDQFLRFRILSVYDQEFSVRDVIDIAANKLGLAHYNPDQAIRLGLDPFDKRVVVAIKNVILRICKSVVKACESLAKEIEFVSYEKCAGHWNADNAFAGRQYLTCDGDQWMEVNLSGAGSKNGISIFLASHLMPIRSRFSAVISLEMGTSDYLELGYDWEGNIYLEYAANGYSDRINFETTSVLETIGSTCVYCVHLEAMKECVLGKISILKKGDVAFEETFGWPVEEFNFKPTRLVFGADRNGKNGARMELSELALFTEYAGDEIHRFQRYLQSKHELAQ